MSAIRDADGTIKRRRAKERLEYLKAGVCPECRLRKLDQPGKRRCSVCLSKAATINDRAQTAAEAAGLCRQCKKRKANSGILCKPCRQAHRIYSQRYRDRKAAARQQKDQV